MEGFLEDFIVDCCGYADDEQVRIGPVKRMAPRGYGSVDGEGAK